MTKANDVTPLVAAAFEVVRSARAALPPAGKRMQKTEDDYAQKYNVLVNGANQQRKGARLLDALAVHAPKGNSFYSNRQAIVATIQRGISSALTEQDKERRVEGYTARWFKLIELIDKALNDIATIRSFTRARALERTGLSKKSVRSKKHDLAKLPLGWREAFVRAGSNSETYRDALGILASTGARPTELKRGVLISAINGQFRVRIQGAKWSDNSGQLFREFEINSSLLSQDLQTAVLSSNGGIRISIANEANFKAHLTRVSKAVFPKLKCYVTAYTFRHALGECLRDDGWEAEELAAVLGHSVSETQALYGRRRSSTRKRSNPTVTRGNVIVARPVRPLDRGFIQSATPRRLGSKR